MAYGINTTIAAIITNNDEKLLSKELLIEVLSDMGGTINKGATKGQIADAIRSLLTEIPAPETSMPAPIDTWEDEGLSMPQELEEQPPVTEQEIPDVSEPETTIQDSVLAKSFKQGYGKHGVVITLPEQNYFESHNSCEDIIKVLAMMTHNGKALWYKGKRYNNQFIANAVNLQDAMMLIVHNTPGMKDSWSSVEKLMRFLIKKGWLTIVNKKKTYRYSTCALSQKSLDLLINEARKAQQ